MRIVLCFLATFITTLSFGQTTDEQQILAIETQITKLSQAGKFKDLAALFEKVCREDFMIINHTGQSADKSTFLAQVDRERTPDQYFETFQKEDKVQLFKNGDNVVAAVVIGKRTVRIKAEAQAGLVPFKDQVIKYYIKQGGSWKAVNQIRLELDADQPMNVIKADSGNNPKKK
jgi:hypothetical protein